MKLCLIRRPLVAIGVVLAILAAVTLSAQEQFPRPEPPAVTPVPPDALPAQAPPRLRLQFTGPNEGFPPRPREMSEVREVPWDPIPGRLTEELEARLQESTLQDPEVRELLGEDFAYIGMDQVEPPKGRAFDDAALRATVTFYSYTHQVALEVEIVEDRVLRAEPRPGYQPPAGAEEIEAAIQLAREDDRISGEVRELDGDAIVMAAPLDAPQAAEHRLLYVTFGNEEDDEPQYFAVVDLTTKTVFAAGPSPEQ